MSPDRPPETVQEYLAQLRRALAGAPAGLVADALADCEEHLNSEIAQKPNVAPRDVLATVIETYGTPEEIAEEYRHMEAAIAGPFPKPDDRATRHGGFFGVFGDPSTYGALLYMVLALPTGIFYFVWAVTGISLSLGFAILIIGIPFALLFLASIRLLSHVEGRIVESLLGVRMPRRLPAPPTERQSLWAQVLEAVTDARTWSSLLYLLLRLPLGVVYFVFATVGIVVPLSFIGAAIAGLDTDQSYVNFDFSPGLNHFFHTAPGLVALGLVGALLFFVTLHLARIIGRMQAAIAELLLVRL